MSDNKLGKHSFENCSFKDASTFKHTEVRGDKWSCERSHEARIEPKQKHCHSALCCDGALCWKARKRATGEDIAHHSTTEPQPLTPQHALKRHTNYYCSWISYTLTTQHALIRWWRWKNLIISISDMATSDRGWATADGWMKLQLEETLVMHYTLHTTHHQLFNADLQSTVRRAESSMVMDDEKDDVMKS